MKTLLYFQQRQETMLSTSLGTIIFAIISFLVCAIVLRNQAVYESYEATKTTIFLFTIAASIIGVFNSVAIHPTEKEYVVPMLKGHINEGIYLRCIFVEMLMLSLLESLIGLAIFGSFDHEIIKMSGILLPICGYELYLNFLFLISTTTAIGFLVGSLLQSIKQTMIAIPSLILSLILFSRGTVELTDGLKRVAEIVPSKHAMAIMGSIINCNQYPTAISLEYPELNIPQISSDLFNPAKDYVMTCFFKQAIILAILLIIIKLFYVIKFSTKKQF